ncbi:glutamine--fructose-6-phosphate aminotransferase [Helicobacter sp. CLO-3]|uniref:glutamine--fructose-6-phosphate transaminase (isomerizing) n=1 Tax=unclassified Helicobacter TaxID=2593540 RepID=UPI000805A19E|nr:MULTISPECIES: glutamine--fructose-6-phosphate transaminase (isomerizing) [unclassified Helicobacter]OBV29041.1 glutamine--fructose-6-phosphate aminotransferase [Helicobacter sp. CLO-3]OHU83065.1 glutamine--fructose-6-phosphate aminotransferase [Helicobacter sp. CLO-3]
MCGIVGYVGSGEKKQILLDGLKELEYRGYDSAGLAVLSNDALYSFKATGKLKNLADKTRDFSSSGFGLGIAHTRWATHGKPTEINAHPHTGEFSFVVHNGIIENYKELKSELENLGHTFISQTDTEVIVHLFEQEFKRVKDARAAWEATASRLQGAYATLLITKVAPDRIFYAKKGAPLIIGKPKVAGGAESKADSSACDIYFASSDAPLIGLVDEVVYLEDGAVGDSSDFDKLAPKTTLSHSKSFAQKEGFRYFMEKEIYEQEQVLLETMMGRVNESTITLDEIDSSLLEGISEITICACGTSYHTAMVGKYLLERKAKMRTNVVLASEFRYAKPILLPYELFIVISQSGETADTLEALKLAKAQGLRTLAICNVDNSSIVRESDCVLLTRAGIEKGVASTKAFATQVMVLWILSVFLGIKREVIDNKGIASERAAMIAAINATKINPALHERIKRLSKRYLHGHGFFFIGRDVFYPLALEGALKLKEISYLHAEGYASGEMKHGPIALVDANLFTIALVPKHLLYEKIASNVEELSARDATICVIAQDEFALADDWIEITKAQSYMEEFFAMMVALQLLSLEIAIRLGNDVDMPRNLAKSVTVE